MAGELVLITGISGFVGFHSALFALQSGYRVRGVIRKPSQIEHIKNAISDPKLVANIEFTIIEDLAATGAFDNALKGVVYFLHVASPMPNTNPADVFNSFFRPAIDMTVNAFSAAAKFPAIRRVVITSSNAVHIPIEEFLAGKLSKEIISADDENCHYDINGQYPHPVLAYAASKCFALEAADEYLRAHKPPYDVVFLMPSYVLGRDNTSTTPESILAGSNGDLLRFLLGQPLAPTLTSTVHIDDVARAHVLSLDSKVPAGRYLLQSDGLRGTQWQEAFGIVEKHFPESIGSTFVKENTLTTIDFKSDPSKVESTFGFKLLGFEEQVKSIVGQYLSLLAK